MDREIAWVKAARKAFEQFPIAVQRRMARALDVAARGEMAEIAKRCEGSKAACLRSRWLIGRMPTVPSMR